jgi:hypothetical protein
MSNGGMVARAIAMASVVTSVASGQKSSAISVQFDWPVGLSAWIDDSSTRFDSSAQRQTTSGRHTRYRRQVVRDARGLRVVVDSISVSKGATAPASIPGLDMARFTDAALRFRPAWIVTREGEFVDLADSASTKAQFDAVMRPVAPLLDSLPPSLRPLIERMFSTAALRTGASQEWGREVSLWVGHRWRTGPAEESGDVGMSPVSDDAIPMRTWREALGERPCTESAASPTCVTLRFRSEPDTAAVNEMLRDLVGRAEADKQREAAGLSAQRTTTLTVVIDPQTARAYELRDERSVVATQQTATVGARAQAVRRDVRVQRFRYAP